MAIKAWNVSRTACIGALSGVLFEAIQVLPPANPSADDVAYALGTLTGSVFAGCLLFAVVTRIMSRLAWWVYSAIFMMGAFASTALVT